MTKRIALILVAVLFLGLFVSCSDDMFGTKEPTDISLDKDLMEYETISEILGKNLQLTATVKTKDGNTTSDNITWVDMPTDTTAFKVISTSKGVLTFQILKPGTYVVTAGVKYKGQVTKTAQCVITIKDALVSIDIRELNQSAFDSKTLYVGNALDLAVDYTPSSTPQTDILWSVDNGDVVTVTEQPNGRAIVTAKKAGTAVITAKSKDNATISDKVTIIVKESGETQKMAVRSVELSGEDTVKVTETVTLTATVTDGNSNTMTSGEVKFSLDDTSKATLQSTSGRIVQVKALKGGQVTVHAEYTNDGVTVTADFPITITGDISAISVLSNAYNVEVGDSQTIDISYSPEDILDSRKGFTWSLDANYLRMKSYDTDKMVVETLKEGTSKITITSTFNTSLKTEVTITAKTAVTEADRIHKVTLSTNSLNYYPSSTGFDEGTLTAYVYRRNDNGSYEIDNTKKVSWSISDPSVATLVENDDNTVAIQPLKPGKAIITAKSRDNEDVTSSANLTVNGALTSLIASTSTVNIVGGEDLYVPLIAFPQYAIYTQPQAQCDNDNVEASVVKTENGYSLHVKAKSLSGTTNVNVYVDGKVMATVKANVHIASPVTIRTIKLSTSNISLKQDADPVYVEAEALDADGNTVDAQILYKGDDNAQSVSKIERIGTGNGFYVYPLNAGYADWFFYTDNAKTEARLHLEVGGGAVTETVKLKAQSDSISIVKGNSQVVKLNVLPFGTELNEDVVWTVKDSSIAYVNGSGLQATVNAIGIGKTTITAESTSGLTASVTVNVVEKALVEDTNISYVKISSSGSTTYLIQGELKKAIQLTATAYKADGTAISGESFSWTIDGSAVQETGRTGNTLSVLTKEYAGYSAPAKIRATSQSNSNAQAVFDIYVATGSITANDAAVFSGVESITLEKGKSYKSDYMVLPSVYNGVFTISTTSDCVEVSLDKNAQTFEIKAVSAGEANVTITDGKATINIDVLVVEKASKKDTSITGVTLDRAYLSYDLATKAPQTITATVYKSGVASNEKVLWSISDESLVSLTENGSSVVVQNKGKVGTVTITATAMNNPDAVASCLVEIIDSTTIAQSLRYVMISESVVELKKGQSTTLTASGQPYSLFAEAEVRWTSSDESVAIVSNGKVKAVGVGEATIKVTADSKSDTCKVIVTEEVASSEIPRSITLSKSLMLLSQQDMDKTFDITATVTSSSGRTISDRSVVWSIEDPNGVIEYSTSYNAISLTPMSSGMAIITAKMDTVTAQLKVIVAEAYVDSTLKSILIYPNPLVLELGKSSEVRATTIPASSEDNLAWAISTPANVEIKKTDNRNVTIKGIQAGTSTITVYSLENPKVSATMTVTVKEGITQDEVTAVKLDKSSIVLDLAEKKLTFVKATVYKGGKVSDGKVTWTYSDGATKAVTVATMDNNTVVLTKKAVGSGYITATSIDDPNFSASFYVEVIDSTEVSQAKLVGTMLNSSAISIEEGTTYSFYVRTVPTNIQPQVSWVVSDESIATIDQNGLLTAKKSGTCTVKAIVEHNGQVQYPTCTVTVYANQKEAEVASFIRFTKNAVYLSQEKMDSYESVTASVFDASYAEMENAEVLWTIADPSIAKIETNGNEVKISPLSAGKTTLKATYRNISNSITVIVGAKSSVLVSKTTQVVFESDTIIMGKNTEKTVKATIIPVGVEDKVSYTINDTSVAEVKANDDGSATITAKQTGTAILTATSVGNPTIKAQMTIKVYESTEDVITAIKLDKNYITLAMDEKTLTELKATVYVNDKASKNITISWSREGLDDSQILVNPTDSYASSVTLTKKGAGSGYIIAKAGDVSARCYVEIVESSVVTSLQDIILSDTNLVLRRNQSYTVGTTMIPDNIVTDIAWTTSDNTVATVNANGTITAVAEGNATITAHSYKYDVHKSVQVQVLADAIENSKASFVRLSVQTVELSQTDGKTKDVVASVIATDGFPIAGAVVTWAMDKDDVASMEVNGNSVTLSPLNSGKTTLRAFYGNLSASAAVYTGYVAGEDVKLDHLSLEPSVLTIQTGGEGELKASSYPAGLEITPSWESTDTDIATVKAGENLVAYVTGVKQGNTTVTIKDRGTEKTTTATVRVRDDISTVITGLSLDKTSLTLDLNQTDAKADINAKVYVANTLNSDESVEWKFLTEDLSGEQTGVISIVENDAKGRNITITPIAEGKGYLRATAKNDSEVYAQVYIRVVNTKTIAKTVTELRLEFDAITMKKGDVRKIKAVTTPEGVTADVRWSVEEGKDVVSVDLYGNVTAKAKGNAVVKAYVYGNATINDTVSITVIDTSEGDVSVYDIGSITITPSSAVLNQDAKLPTSFTAKVYDRNGKALDEENVEWVTTGLGKIAEVARTEGNTIYLMAKDAGRGTLTAQRTSQDGSVVSKTVDIYSGEAPVDPENPVLESIVFDTSSPLYLVLNDEKKVNVTYRPNYDSLKGLVWTLKNDTGFISSTMDDNSITIKALAVTSANPQITATSRSLNASGKSVSATMQVKVVKTKDDLPAVTSLVLDKTAIILNLATKADTVVTATGYDYEGKKVENAAITWSLEDNSGTNLTLTTTSGKSVGINKGSSVGTVKLVAKCGEVKAYCDVEVTDTTNFSGISLSSDTVYLTVGSSFKITVYGTPSSLFTGATVSKGGDVESVTVTADPSNKTFSIQANNAGSTSLRFTTEVGGKTYSADAFVYVNETETLGVSRIVFVPSSAYIQVGKTVDFTARLYDRKGNEVYSETNFSITDPNVASITKNGSKATVKGLNAGTATVYAKSGDIEAPAFISVGTTEKQETITSLVKIIPGMSVLNLKKGEIAKVNLSTVPSDNTDEITGTSNQTNVATITVDGREATITAVGNGTAILTLSSGAVSEKIEVKVAGASVPSYIKLDSTSISFDQTAGQSATVSATVYDADGSQLSQKVNYWKADDDSIVNLTDLGNGSVKVEPKNSGSTYVWAYCGEIKAGFRVAVAEKQSTATGPSSITMATPSLTLQVGSSETVSVLYQPNGLTDNAKGVTWASSNPAVATVQGVGTGEKATVKALSKGEATLTASAISTKNVVATMKVTVLSTDSTEDVYKLSLDKNSVRMNPSTEVVVKATLTKNGEEIDASNVQWTFEGNTIGMAFVGSNMLSQNYKGHTVTLHANQDNGYAYVVATYGNASAKIQIEVADLTVVEDTGLRSVIISDKTMLMEVGEKATFKATVNPSVTGVRYSWTQTEEDGTTAATGKYVNFISQSGSNLTVSAIKTGTVVLNLEAILEGFPSVKDSVTIQILKKGSTWATYKYSSMKMDKATLSLSQGSDMSRITATLVDTDKKDTTDAISKWALLNEKGEVIFYWEGGKYYYNGQVFDSFSDLKTYDASFADVNNFSVIDLDGAKRMVGITPGKAGIYFVEAYGPEEGTKDNPIRVSARTMINVSGSISAVTFSSSYIHLIKDASTTVTVSRDPATAKITNYEWSRSGEDNTAIANRISLSEKTEDSVIVTGTSLGDEDLTYTATDINGHSVSCTVHITVHDISWGTGGIKQIAFPNSFVTLGFPYTAQSFKATAYYMDGTTASDAEITYRKQVSIDGVWTDVEDASEIKIKVTCPTCNGVDYENCTNKDCADGKVDKLIATYSEGQDHEITIVPVDKGEFRIVAELSNNGQDYSSEMYVSIGGNSNTLTPSSTSVVLYTGGSASISLKLDNPAYDSGFYAQILSEYTADGYLIEDSKIKATGESMKEALKIANSDSRGFVNATDLVLGSRILVTNKTAQEELNKSKDALKLSDDDFIGLDADYASDSFKRILETFPRKATVRVTTRDGQSSTDISVTIRRLPEGNSYPISIGLSEDKVDLQPPFTQEQSITATLYDQLGNETSGTIEWYFYQVGKSYTDKADNGSLKWQLNTLEKNEREELDAYFNGKTMYYTPKKAGLYRLLVLCKQNPQLSYESTINVAGDVTGISSSTGQNLSVAKNNSAEISAVFTPTNALARNVFFAVDETVGTGVAAKILNPDEIYSNAFIRVSIGANTATVTGLTGTVGNDLQRIRILYGKQTKDDGKLETAYRNGYFVRLVGKEQFIVVDSAGNAVVDADGKNITINAYYSVVNVTVTVTKALYSFTTQSSRSIDPSALENGKISFDFTSSASSEDGSSSVSPFSRWDWLECRIVGDDSGLVYASSVPVNDAGKSLYEVEKTTKNGETTSVEKVWGWYDDNGIFQQVDTKPAYYYNYEKEEYSYRENTTDTEWTPIILSGGKAYYVNSSYKKQEIKGVTYADLQNMADNSASPSGNFLVKRNAMGLATKTGDYSGSISQDNGGTTYFFKLNSDAISDETLRIQVRLQDKVKYGNPVYTNGVYSTVNPYNTYGYDSEAVQINQSNLALSIGGRIQNIYTGTVIRENHGSTVSETLVQNIEQIKMYEGASVTLIPSFNPTSTHEKGLKWELQGVAQTGGVVTQEELNNWITYSELDGSQLMITAKSFGAITDNDHRTVYVIARSTSDASVYCRYEIDIQTMIKSLKFTSIGQVQTNKNITSGTTSSPVYKNVSTDSSPATEGLADIYCFDTTDVSGGGGNIDAYYISYTPNPDYGYDFNVELVNNMADGTSQVIGTIDKTGIGNDVKAFRFIPTGRVYSKYDDTTGQGTGDYTVAYGDVKMRIYNAQINYSKEFTIHYSPASFRLVKNIDNLNAETNTKREAGTLFTYGLGQFSPDELSAETKKDLDNSWDYLWQDSTKTLQSMECVVLYNNGESIDLSFAGTVVLSEADSLGNIQNKTVLQSYANPSAVSKFGADGLPKNVDTSGNIIDKMTVTWELIKAKGNNEPAENVCFEGGGTSYTSTDLNVATIKAVANGRAYLQYTIEYPLVNKDGEVVMTSKLDENDNIVEEIQKVKLTSGVPVYVISEIDPELMRVVQASLGSYSFLKDTYVSALIPERVSRAQKEKWYALSASSGITDSEGNAMEGAIYTGRTYASFDILDGDAPVYIGTAPVYGLNQIEKKITETPSQEDGKRGITLALGSKGDVSTIAIPSICTALISSKTEFALSNIQTSDKDYLLVDGQSKDWGAKNYTDIDFRDLSKIKWVTGLEVDMAGLTEDGVSVGIELSDLLSSNEGDFSNTGVSRISIKGNDKEQTKTGLSSLKLANSSIYKTRSITLSNVAFNDTANVISGEVNEFTATNVDIRANVNNMNGAVSIDSATGLFTFGGVITKFATLKGNPSITLQNCTIGIAETDFVMAFAKFTGSFAVSGGTFANPKGVSITLPAVNSFTLTGGALGTSSEKPLNTLSFSGNGGITTFSLEGVYVSNLDLSECTSLASSVQEKWNSWKVASLKMQNTNLTSISITNNTIETLDFSNNKKLESLSVSGNNCKKIDASSCVLITVTVDCSERLTGGDDKSGLFLNNNKLGTPVGEWEVLSIVNTRIYSDSRPTDQSRPSNPSDGTKYSVYLSISDKKTETCSTCGGDGCLDTTHRVYFEVTETKTITTTHSDWIYTGGSYVDPSTGKTYKSNVTTEEVEYTYTDYEDVYDVCPNCSGDGYFSYYDVTEKIWNFKVKNKLSINGHSIPLSKDFGMDNTSSITEDFATCWEGISGMKINLSDNKICYKAGFKHSKTNATWNINFTVRLMGVADNMYVAKYYNGGGNDDGHYNFTGWFKGGDVKWEFGKNTTTETKQYTLKSLGGLSSGVKTTFQNHRDKSIPGWDIFPAGSARGPEMYIYPFGETKSLTE